MLEKMFQKRKQKPKTSYFYMYLTYIHTSGVCPKNYYTAEIPNEHIVQTEPTHCYSLNEKNIYTCGIGQAQIICLRILQDLL